MSGNKLFLDTNIIIYVLKGDKTLGEILDNKQLYISSITEIELLSYPLSTPEEDIIVKNFINDCIIIDLTKNIKEHAIVIRRKYKLKLPDSIIVASAKYIDIPLITADKEFQRIKELELILYE